MSATTTGAPTSPLRTVRQLVLHVLLFILLMVFISGLGSLFTSAFQGFAVDDFGSSPLPLALAQVIIAGPLAWVLWRRIRGFLLLQGENASLIWSVQAAAVYALGAMISVHNFSTLLGQLAGLRPGFWQDQLGLALAWGLLAIWQHRILTNDQLAPRRLRNLGRQLAAYYFLLVAALSLAALLYIALSEIVPQEAVTRIYGSATLPILANIFVWVLLNAAAWAWHWFRLRLRNANDDVASVLLVLSVAVSTAFCLLGTVFALSSVLPLPAGSESLPQRMAQVLPVAAGFALAGALAWIYFAAIVAQKNKWLREAGRQVVSGIALALTASGFGMIINALLTTLNASLAGNTASDILRTGSALFVVGLVTWLVFWRPAIQAPAEHRRIYLVLVFGLSAVVALVALIVVGYRIFAFYLTPDQAGPTLLGEVRAALGLLLATAAVASYHFAVWRSDRKQLDRRPPASAAPSADATPTPPADGLRSLIVITDAGNAGLAAQLRRHTGLPVQHLVRSDGSSTPVPDFTELSTRLEELPSGTHRALIFFHGEQVLVLPVEPGTSAPEG